MPLTMYEQLLAPFSFSHKVSEEPIPYLLLTERHLQVMWLEQKYFKPLCTHDGLPIKVLSPGIWNAEAGPDFLKAHLLIGDKEYRGDIELHLSDESWYHHRHHLDDRYNNVVLHISFWKAPKEIIINTHNQHSLIRSYFEDNLTISQARIIQLIDIDLYPYKSFCGSGKCSRNLFKNLSKANIQKLFRSAATWRLKQKAAHLHARAEGLSDPFAIGIATTLGFKRNSEPFYDLFIDMKKHIHSQALANDEHSLYAYAIGKCGFFNAYFVEKWSHSPFYQQLQITYNQFPSYLREHTIKVRCDGIRPANHPLRRLALLVKILMDPSIQHLQKSFYTTWQCFFNEPKRRKWNVLKEELQALLPTYADPYWETHYTFEVTPQSKAISLMGEDLKKEILINVGLPLLYKDIDSSQYQEAFEEFYASIPAPKTRKATYLSQRFFGNTQKNVLLSRSDLQQGAYQIHKDFCTHFEASCIGCPFVERYSEAVKNKNLALWLRQSPGASTSQVGPYLLDIDPLAKLKPRGLSR